MSFKCRLNRLKILGNLEMSHDSNNMHITASLIQHSYFKKYIVPRYMEDIKVVRYCHHPGGFYNLGRKEWKPHKY